MDEMPEPEFDPLFCQAVNESATWELNELAWSVLDYSLDQRALNYE